MSVFINKDYRIHSQFNDYDLFHLSSSSKKRSGSKLSPVKLMTLCLIPIKITTTTTYRG